MSSMHRRLTGKPLKSLALLGASALAFSAPLASEEMTAADQARVQMVAQQPRQMGQAIDRWQFLVGNDRLSFTDYAGFVLAYPGFPQESRLRTRAEDALDNEAPSTEAMVGFFDRNPPLTNSGRARYALALSAMGRPEAADMARQAWRGGEMSGTAEAYISGLYGSRFTQDDHDTRMDALLWHSDAEGARRQLSKVSPARRKLFAARLQLVENAIPAGEQLEIEREDLSDPGLAYNLARHYRKNQKLPQAIDTLTSHPRFTSLPFDAEDMISEMLVIARGSGSQPAARIAASADQLFEPATDISQLAYKLRDDYTSLMWLGGTKALWNLGDGKQAAPLFYRYGAAARTPQTRSKGFYWAGLASQRAGDNSEARRYWEMAAEYPDRFYGMLALEKLGRPIPALTGRAAEQITQEQRAAFNEAPLTKAVREVAKGASWRTGIQFYRAISDQAESKAEHLMVADLAAQTGRRDLAVNLADSAQEHGYDGFTAIGYPVMETPPGTYWTMVHAITRQESQFAQNAISHAGARGLMQLMPGTAREQAGKLGMNYMSADLIDSPSYNVQLGSAYFERMLSYYNGSYPLAVAAYNAGPGNVNKWLRANGDPRTGAVDWLNWIEQIPIYETKNYVQRVLENAAVYEQLYPDKAPYGKPRQVSSFLR
ncbi:lytic transglycosylase domain-containing protein [Erythrobacteraceae bacterium E2-1 Yellow Sea]|nr:lytic transglycosylase domain-containing protein [Erythrobacteraceae bacterium E2-1 Yellow Sea]